MNFKETFIFLKKLKENNTKEWFDANRKQYEIIKKDFNGFVKTLLGDIQKWDKSIIGLEPKDCIFRINRDIRFSKDKSPYKTNIGAGISMGGRKSMSAGYYIHLEPGNKSMLAGGMYMPESDVLKKIRQEIDYNHAGFLKIINHKDFKKHFGTLTGETLSSVPKGYDAQNKAIEYLKHKSFLMVHSIKDTDFKNPDIYKHLLQVLKSMKPLDDFLNESLADA
ncbi:MAG: DUF2461 domain-containing protein [Bacteroidota bacterium]|nr:DUF2461 domain-containing protein [Bacteroidota bacterium]